MSNNVFQNMMVSAMAALVSITSVVLAAPQTKAPPGMFKDLNDEILGDSIIVRGKQLFIDDYIIGELKGVEKLLNQPVKHPKNPLVVPDELLEKSVRYGTGAVMYDEEEQIFKMWNKGYLTSKDGITWTKIIINENEQAGPGDPVRRAVWDFFDGSGVFKDPVEIDQNRRYKMLYNANPDGTKKTISTNAAYSPDGINWTAEPANPIIPYSDAQPCPYWDAQIGRYVAYVRFGPPNTRIISRIESRDFVHWSPKVTVLRKAKWTVRSVRVSTACGSCRTRAFTSVF